MKKLMVMIGAVATSLGLFADDFVSKTGFENATAGSALEDLTVLEDEASGAGWTATGAEKVDVVAYSGSDAGYSVMPAQFTDNGNQYLSIKTALGTGSLTRTFAEEPVNADGIYADMNVKFTAFDSDADIPAGAKIAVWVKEDEEAGTTNLIVTAGYDNAGTLEAKDYVVRENFDYAAWHRVTIKAIGNSTKGSTAFVVFLDPTFGSDDKMHASALSSAEEKGTAGWLDGYSDSAKAFAADGQLFPALVVDDTLSAVAFSGTGDIDSLVVTDVVPFDEAKDKAFYTLTCGDNIASFKVGDETVMESKQILFEGATTVSVTEITPATGYFVASTTAEIEVSEAGTYTVGTAQTLGATVTIGSETTSYVSVAAAMAAVNAIGEATSATLSLVAAESGAIELDNANVNLTLDLAGKTIASDNEEVAAITVTAGTLNIIDSSDPSTGVVMGKYVEGDDYYAGAVYTDPEGEGTITIAGGTFYGDASTAASITGGKFSYGDNGAEGVCYLTTAGLPEGKIWVADDEQNPQWWVIGDAPIENPVAKIGDVEYTTIQAAFDAAEDGDTVRIIAAVTNEALSITGTAKDAYAITVQNDAEVVWTEDVATVSYGLLINGATVTFTGTGKWVKTGGSASIIQAGATTVADITITTGTFIGGVEGMAANSKDAPNNLIASKGGKITVTAGTFVNYRGTEGRCVRAEGSAAANAEAIINGGTFEVRCDSTELEPVASRHICVDHKGQTTGSVTINAGLFKMPAQSVDEFVNAEGWCGTGYKLKLNSDGWYERTAITYATLTITAVENCTISVTNVAGEVITTGAKFDVDDATVLYVTRTPATGYELAAGCLAEETITMNQDRTVTAVVQQVAPAYPTYLEGASAEAKERYTNWAATYGADTGSVNKDAFLLNCDPKDVDTAKANFKIISIENVEGNWEVKVSTEKGQGQQYGNGFVNIISVRDTFGADGMTADFFKAELTIDPVVKAE